ncbi:MAG: hypothetical protein ACRDJ1_01180 [Actinomycetota bacterium]
MKRLGARLAVVAPVLFLAACTEQEADAAARGFFNWMMLLILIGVLAFILWALVLAGGIAAIISGVRRMNRDREPPPPPSMTPAGPAPTALPPAGTDPPATVPDGAPPLPASRPPDRKPGADPAAIALIVFGGLLVLGAGPFVLFGNEASNGFFSVQIPLPMLILAAGLVYWGVKRSRG